MTRHDTDSRAGIVLAGSAYALWGVLPLYWHFLAAVPPLEITCWRILLTASLVLAVTAARGRLAQLRALFATPALLKRLAVSAALIGANWTVFVYSVTSHQLVEASLGYFVLPLISIALGVLMLGERLSRVRLAALILASLAVAAQTIALGRLPWIALVLALTFGFYGFVRKTTAVGPLEGLFVETACLSPIATLVLVYWSGHGGLTMSLGAPARDGLLLLSGPVTALPLSLFAAGARRIRLSTLGFLQYLSPSITLVIAVALLGEGFRPIDLAAFGAVWTALALIAAEGQLARVRAWALTGR